MFGKKSCMTLTPISCHFPATWDHSDGPLPRTATSAPGTALQWLTGKGFREEENTSETRGERCVPPGVICVSALPKQELQRFRKARRHHCLPHSPHLCPRPLLLLQPSFRPLPQPPLTLPSPARDRNVWIASVLQRGPL